MATGTVEQRLSALEQEMAQVKERLEPENARQPNPWTDHVFGAFKDDPLFEEALRLKSRVAAVPPDDLATSIVSYEEQTRGWLAVSAQARTPQAQIAAYERLKRHLEVYCRIAVVAYDEKAA